MMLRSTAMPAAPATRNASGTAMNSEASNSHGACARITSCTTKVV
jgi:hypothetical protein